MLRVHTFAIVAFVQHMETFGDFTDKEHIGNAMRLDLSIVDREFSITIAMDCRLPL